MNIAGFDIIIFIVAMFTIISLFFTNKNANNLCKKMHGSIYLPDKVSSFKEANRKMSNITETELTELRGKVGKSYSIYVNLTSIFPLLGILGTVVSLLGLVSEPENVTGNFYGALTSTFWGLIFAIIFKFLDGLILNPKMEQNEKDVELYLNRSGSSKILEGKANEEK